MSMTKKDFELIAETVSNLPWSPMVTVGKQYRREVISRETLVKELADMLAGTNGNFDRSRFIDACLAENYRAPRNVTRY